MLYRPKSTNNTLMSLGDTPGMRLACAKGFRVYLHQLLAGFGRQGLQVRVVKLALDPDGLQPVYLVGNRTLPVDVAFVLDADFGCLDYLFFSVLNLVERLPGRRGYKERYFQS